MAAEGGSRSFGLESKDSDYDIRVIYVQHPDKYTSILDPPDVKGFHSIESDMDIAGWDLRKAVRLLHKSNADVINLSWSPIKYIEVENIGYKMVKLADQYFNPKALGLCYLKIASNYFGDWAESHLDMSIPCKEYLHAARCIMSVMYIERFGTLPPLSFSLLLQCVGSSLPTKVKSDINLLVVFKRDEVHDSVASPVPSLHSWIKEEIPRLKQWFEGEQVQPRNFPVEEADDLFRSYVEVAGRLFSS